MTENWWQTPVPLVGALVLTVALVVGNVYQVRRAELEQERIRRATANALDLIYAALQDLQDGLRRGGIEVYYTHRAAELARQDEQDQ